MADTIYALGSPLISSILSEELLDQAIYASPISKFISSDDDAAIRIMDDLTRRPGDTIQYWLRKKLIARGTIGFDRLKGKESRIQSLPDQFSINALAHAVSVVGEMTQQRVPWPLRKEARDLLSGWLKERIGVIFCNQLGGNTNAGYGAEDDSGIAVSTGAQDPAYTGFNSCVAPATSNFVFPNSNISAESDLTGPGVNGSNLFNLQMLNRFVTKAKTVTFPLKPLLVGSEPYFIAMLHPYSRNDLQSQTGEGTWESIQLARMTGGQISDNPLFTGSIGMYNRVIMHEEFHVPFGNATPGTAQTSSNNGNGGTVQNVMGTALGAPANGTTNVARNLLFGAQAAVIAFGRKTSWPDQIKWVEESDDYMRELGVAMELVFGGHKSQFTDTSGTVFDLGVMVGSCWAQIP